MPTKIRPGTKNSFLTDIFIPSLLNIEMANDKPTNKAREYDNGRGQKFSDPRAIATPTNKKIVLKTYILVVDINFPILNVKITAFINTGRMKI